MAAFEVSTEERRKESRFGLVVSHPVSQHQGLPRPVAAETRGEMIERHPYVLRHERGWRPKPEARCHGSISVSFRT